MTLDGAIKHYKEEAEKYMEYGIETECYQCGKENEQLAEWLTELKELRNSVGAVKLKDMKEAVKLLQELNTENEQLTSQLAEAKRLLKLAIEDFKGMQFGNECKVCSKNLLPNECPIHNNVACILEKDFKWRYADEAEKLIES